MPSLKSLHTFGFEAQAHNIQYIESFEALKTYSKELLKQPSLILGEGSNTIFIEDFKGSVFVNRLKGIKQTETDSHFMLEVKSGENWHEFVSYCHHNHINGFENLALIPGTVGASPIQNIGAYGVEVKEYIEFVEYFDLLEGTFKRVDKKSCQFAYRDSIFKSGELGPLFITQVGFKLSKKQGLINNYAPLDKIENPTPSAILDKVIETRKTKLPDPKSLGNAGSFFKNPVISKQHYQEILKQYPNCPHYTVDKHHVKVPAAYLIDSLGFKGKSIGGIRCHEKQPLVLVNANDGKGLDLLTLAREICDAVKSSFDICLENEVRLIGQDGLISL